ncbi:homeobox and leucine zipper encoding b [Alosa sapidissima]|uniref:homeobox and leucine zipper encoding b n=1 Tax=Alosa sapidissima TaxID=34773 RepID=UPI001C09F24A|nr:homeobox and leucine zipper encoding b [Alosa sapidissima]XP_041926154.1 homeobox and leucine zipper encoding b [Alosa sapidissima]
MEGHMQPRRYADTERMRDEWKDVVDVHRCHICGFTAGDVGSLSVHLSSAHPTTVQPHPSRYTSNVEHGQRQEEEVEERKPLSACLSGERNPKTPRGLDATGEGFEDNTRSRESAEPTPLNGVTKAQQQQASLRSATTSSQRTTPPFVPERTQVGPLPSSPATPVTATSGLNRPHVVCLPQVAERLKLAWQRSDPVHELDGQRALVEAFNAFPYPTSQETGALARQCALPVDDVKTWFMMQRVRYGISWAEEDIRETRHKLHTLRGEPEQSKEVDAASPGTVTPAVRPSEEEMMMTVDEDDQYDYYDEDDDGEEEEMMRAFGASEGMIAERKRQYLPAALWSAPPLTQLEPPPDAGSLQRTAAVELHHFPLHQPPLHQPPLPGVPSIGHLSASPPFVLTGQPLRMRSKKSRAQLMVLRRSFVISNWPSEGELQRLQGVTALSRHEIRKWFADSRYQLRRSGGEHKTPQRSSHAPGAAHEWKVAAPPDVLPRTSLGDGQPPGASGPGGEVEVVIKQEDHRDALRTFIRTKESHAKIASGVEAVPSLNGHSEASSASSAPTLSSYLLPGYPGGVPGLPVPERHQRLRKKTSEQTEVLRQAFLRCQWPTAEDYSRLEQLTGLPRTQIIHWFGDTRYSFKHARLRWIGPDERRDIATRLEMDASRAWQVRWHKQWPGLGTDGPPQPSPGNWMDASNSSTSSVQTLDGMAGGDFDRWYDLWDGAVQGQGGGAAGGGL